MTYTEVKTGAKCWHSFKDLGPKRRREAPIDKVRVIKKDGRKGQVFIAGVDAHFGMWVNPSNLTKQRPRLKSC